MTTRFLLVCLVVGGTRPGSAQASTPGPVAPPERSLALTAGLGNLYGGLGASVEKYLGGDLMSLSLGLGGIPETDEAPGVVAFGAALRRYAGRARDRLFVELALVRLSTTYSTIGPGQFENVRPHYGPGLAIGYQLTDRGGFTFVVDAGAGWAVGASDPLSFTAALGMGYTWHR